MPTSSRRTEHATRNAAEQDRPTSSGLLTWHMEITVSQNLLSLTLSDAQLKSVDDALTTLETALSELISLEGMSVAASPAWVSSPRRSAARS